MNKYEQYLKSKGEGSHAPIFPENRGPLGFAEALRVQYIQGIINEIRVMESISTHSHRTGFTMEAVPDPVAEPVIPDTRPNRIRDAFRSFLGYGQRGGGRYE